MELDRVYERNDRVVSRRIVDELILVPVRQSVADLETLYTLNEVGARVYELIDGKRTVGDILETIIAEFHIDRETAQPDVETFVEQLVEMDGIRLTSGP